MGASRNVELAWARQNRGRVIDSTSRVFKRIRSCERRTGRAARVLAQYYCDASPPGHEKTRAFVALPLSSIWLGQCAYSRQLRRQVHRHIRSMLGSVRPFLLCMPLWLLHLFIARVTNCSVLHYINDALSNVNYTDRLRLTLQCLMPAIWSINVGVIISVSAKLVQGDTSCLYI